MLSTRHARSIPQRLHVYARRNLSADVIAGLTVAVTAIPQSMAFALIAGINPLYGLYTAIVSTIVGSLMGKSTFLSTGPTNALSLVVGSTLAPFAGSGDELARLVTLTLLVGLFQLGMGLLRLGDVSRFVSNAVMVGFVTGAGLLIAIGQLGNLLGVSVPGGSDAFTTVYDVLKSLPQANLNTLGVGLLTAWLAVGLRRTPLKSAAPLLAIVASGALVAMFNPQDMGVRLVSEVTHIPRGLPALTPVAPVEVSALAPRALAIALLGLVQSISIMQSLAPTTGDHPEPSREFVGQGLANVVGAFFQCMPAGGSLSRTAVNVAAGAQTRLAGAFSGVFVAAVLVLFGPLAERIPMSSLAGLLIIVAGGLINRDRIALVWRTAPTSRTVFLVTFAATLIFPLEYSIYLGALLSIANYLQASSHPHVAQLVPTDGSFREVPLPDKVPSDHPILISVTGNIHFAAIQDIEEKLPDFSQVEHPIIILRLRGTDLLASTGVTFLESLLEPIHAHHGTLILCGVGPSVARTLRRSGLMQEMGEENVFCASDLLLESTQLALRRARELQHQANGRAMKSREK